jgi:tRNA (guanine6-N2)-methyltransferase
MTTTYQRRPLTYYVQTMPGVEKIAWQEIQQRFPQASLREYLFVKDQNGIVLFDDDVSFKELLTLRTAEDVFVRVAHIPRLTYDYGDLRQIERLLETGDELGKIAHILTSYLKLTRRPTFRVVARKTGDHRYNRAHLEKALELGIQRRFGKGWRQVEENADFEVWGNVLGPVFVCGIRLSDRTMRHRHNRAVELPASLRPSVAAAMVFLSQPHPHDVFLDPMCGSGTILLERLAFGDAQTINGADIMAGQVQATQANLGKKGRRVLLWQGDGERLPVAASSVDKIVCNLPFGHQIGTPAQIKRLYPAFLAEVARVLRPGGKAVLLSSEFDRLKEAIRQQPSLEIGEGHSIAVLGKWGRIYVVEKVG